MIHCWLLLWAELLQPYPSNNFGQDGRHDGKAACTGLGHKKAVQRAPLPDWLAHLPTSGTVPGGKHDRAGFDS